MIYDVYVDESSQTQNRYLLLGALMIPSKKSQSALDAISEIRAGALPTGEMKWGKVSRAKLEVYQGMARLFFTHHAMSEAKFHCLVVDTSRLDHQAYNSGSSEIGFNKEIYQLAKKCAHAEPNAIFHLYPDFRDTNQHPEDLRSILNHGLRKTGDNRDWPFRRCQFRDSKKSTLNSIVDIFIGSIGYKLNGHYDKPEASSPKQALCSTVLSLAGIRDVTRDTSRFGKFTIWHRQLRGGGRP